MSPRIVFLVASEQPGFYKLHRVEDAEPLPGLAICLVQSSVLFFSADQVKGEIETLAEDLPSEHAGPSRRQLEPPHGRPPPLR